MNELVEPYNKEWNEYVLNYKDVRFWFQLKPIKIYRLAPWTRLTEGSGTLIGINKELCEVINE